MKCRIGFWLEKPKSVHLCCMVALYLGAGVEQPFGCLITENRQAMLSIRRSMDWALKNNMVNGLYLVWMSGVTCGIWKRFNRQTFSKKIQNMPWLLARSTPSFHQGGRTRLSSKHVAEPANSSIHRFVKTQHSKTSQQCSQGNMPKWPMVYSSAPHSQAVEGAIPHLRKQEKKRATPVRRRLGRTHAVLGRGHSRRVNADAGDESRKYHGVLQPLSIPSGIRPEHRTSVVVVRWTDELLCGGCKWLSWFELACIPTRWTGERWVEQASSLPGTACWRQRGSFVVYSLIQLCPSSETHAVHSNVLCGPV